MSLSIIMKHNNENKKKKKKNGKWNNEKNIKMKFYHFLFNIILWYFGELFFY